MSDAANIGILYTEHSRSAAVTPIASLWSYETRTRERERRNIGVSPDGNPEYWLDRWDPLLNAILPGTHVSLIFNFGDLWASGRSLPVSAYLPRVSVVGPVTQARILRVGRDVRAVGVVIPPTLTSDIFDVPASELVDRIVPLHDLWNRDEVERLFEELSCLDIGRCPSTLTDEVLGRLVRGHSHEDAGQTAPRIIKHRAGRVSIDDLARSLGLSRQQFAVRFRAANGLPPKLFARITRFQSLVHALLANDVSRWASISSATGFYDQAHMINEFRTFAGSPPTTFFQPHDRTIDPARIQLRGRPGEWLRPPFTR
jgi:AraC-like DNA-binding protein